MYVCDFVGHVMSEHFRFGLVSFGICCNIRTSFFVTYFLLNMKVKMFLQLYK